MSREELEKLISEAVEAYIAADESYDDAAQLRVDPKEWKVDIADVEDADDDSDPRDYYDIMDLVEMTPDGAWTLCPEAVASVAAEYFA